MHLLALHPPSSPPSYQAIQSHRAAMAVLRQQQGFVQQLFEAGMVDEVRDYPANLGFCIKI